jgi:hypothetical protein
VIPESWIEDTLTPDPDSVEAFLASEPDAEQVRRGSFYRNQFWVLDPAAPIYRCSGINGRASSSTAPARS